MFLSLSFTFFFFIANHRIVFVGYPEFTLMPKDQTVVKGESANLPCAASAVPKPKILWKLEGVFLHDAEVTQNGTLRLRRVENNQLYEGSYTCEASNSVGTKSSTAKLTVYGK